MDYNDFDVSKHFKIIYICKSCGCIFATKFMDSDKCLKCSKDMHDEITERLKNNPDHIKTLKSINYINNKTKT